MVRSLPLLRTAASSCVGAIVSALTIIPTVNAQQRGDPVSVGMARASVATSRGLSAISSNIGALGMDPLGTRPDRQRVELDLSIIPFGASAGSTYLSASDLDFVFASKNREDFSDADRLRLAGLLEEGRLSADASVDLVNFRLRAPGVGALMVRYGHRVRAQMTFPENFRANVLQSGDIYDGGEIFRDPEIGGEWTRTLSFGLASAWERPINPMQQNVWFPSVGFGFNLGYTEGIVHFDIDDSSWAQTRRIASAAGEPYRRIHVQGYYTFRSSEPLDSTFNPSDAVLQPGFIGSKNAAATGWEGGIGIAVVVLRTRPIQSDGRMGDPLKPQVFLSGRDAERDAIVFGATIEGVGSLLWDGMNTRRRYDAISDTLSEKDGPVSNEIIYRFEAPLDTIGAFRTRLPALARIGAAADLTAFIDGIPGDLIASVEFASPLNRAIGWEVRDRFSVGGEWRPTPRLALRSGLQFGGRLGVAMALGVGLRPLPWLSLDAGTSEVTSLFFSDRRRVDLAFRGAIEVHF